MPRESTDSKAMKTALDALKVELLTKLEALEDRIDVLEIALPPSLRALNDGELAKVIQENPYVELEVLESWRHPNGETITAGRVMRADLYGDLPTYVQHGLKVGVPTDQTALVDKLRDQKTARDQSNASTLAERAQGEAVKTQQAAAEAQTRAQALKS